MVPETPRQLNELVALAKELQDFLESQRWSFCFIGGMAVQCWSEPRYTKDVDLTLLTGFGGEEPFIDALLARYKARLADARSFALMHRVLLLENDQGIGIDIALGALAFEESAVSQARLVEAYPGIFLRMCSPEDLIIMKAFASRPRDWEDIRMTLVRQGVETLDWDHIRRHLTELAALKEAPEILDQLEALKARYS